MISKIKIKQKNIFNIKITIEYFEYFLVFRLIFFVKKFYL